MICLFCSLIWSSPCKLSSSFLELYRLRASVATQQSTIENQERNLETRDKIIAGVGGVLGFALGVLLIAFIGLLVAFVVVAVMWTKLKKIAKQQLGTELNAVNKKAVLAD